MTQEHAQNNVNNALAPIAVEQAIVLSSVTDSLIQQNSLGEHLDNFLYSKQAKVRDKHMQN